MPIEVSRETFRPAEPSDAPQIEALAQRIWWHTYPPIIGATQTRYMLELMYRPEQIRTDMAAGHRYCLLLLHGEPRGFHALETRHEGQPGRARLHKLYLDPALHGRGLGQAMLGQAMADALEHGATFMDLTVNKYNEQAIRAYRRAGFARVGEIVKPIGQGYVMDDYLMARTLSRQRPSLDTTNAERSHDTHH